MNSGGGEKYELAGNEKYTFDRTSKITKCDQIIRILF